METSQCELEGLASTQDAPGPYRRSGKSAVHDDDQLPEADNQEMNHHTELYTSQRVSIGKMRFMELLLCALATLVLYSISFELSKASEGTTVSLEGYGDGIYDEDDEIREDPPPSPPAPPQESVSEGSEEFVDKASEWRPAHVMWYSTPGIQDSAQPEYLTASEYYGNIEAFVVRFRPIAPHGLFDYDQQAMLKLLDEEPIDSQPESLMNILSHQPHTNEYPPDLMIGLHLDPENRLRPLSEIRFGTSVFSVYHDFVEVNSQGYRLRVLVVEPTAYPIAAELGEPYVDQSLMEAESAIQDGLEETSAEDQIESTESPELSETSEGPIVDVGSLSLDGEALEPELDPQEGQSQRTGETTSEQTELEESADQRED